VWPALLAPVIAPLAGGLITTYASWRWLFLINIPLGALGVVCAWRLVDGRSAEAAPRLDLAGVLLTCGGLAALTYVAHLATPLYGNYRFRRVLLAASVCLTLTTIGCAFRAHDSRT
jgi:MFS family permease